MKKIFLSLSLATLVALGDVNSLLLKITSPTDNQILNLIKSDIEYDYRKKFDLINFKRLNGWKGELDTYIVKVSYDLIAKENILLEQHLDDVPFYVRLNTLSFYTNIQKDTIFNKTKKLRFRYTEKGWIKENLLESFINK